MKNNKKQYKNTPYMRVVMMFITHLICALWWCSFQALNKVAIFTAILQWATSIMRTLIQDVQQN